MFSNADSVMDIFETISVFKHTEDELTEDESTEPLYWERQRGSMFRRLEIEEAQIVKEPFDHGWGCGDGYTGGNGASL